MPDETPGTSPADPAATDLAPQTTGAPPQDAQPTGSPQTAASDPYAEFPQEFRDKVKEREKAAAEEAVKRAKAGAEGGWLSSVPPELREELKRDPSAYWRIKAENEALKGIVGNGKAKETASDPVEEVYKWADEEVKRRPDLTVSDLNRIQIQAADRISQIRSKQAAQDAYPALSHRDREQQVSAQPEMQDVLFHSAYQGMKERLKQMGKPPDPYIAYQMTREAWGQKFPNAPVLQKPAPSFPSADTKRTPASPPAQPALSPREKWLKSDGARGLQDD